MISDVDLTALSPQERAVVTLLASGDSNQEIADAMNLSPNTVKTVLGRAMLKAGVRNRTTLALAWQRQELFAALSAPSQAS